MAEGRGSRRQRNAPKISDVAARAGVSPMTVSRVINGEANVRPETRERVEEAIKALDYTPSIAARTLAGGEEIRIGLLHSNPSFNYLSQLLVGSLDQASRLNVQLIVEKCDDEAEEQSAVDHLIRGAPRRHHPDAAAERIAAGARGDPQPQHPGGRSGDGPGARLGAFGQHQRPWRGLRDDPALADARPRAHRLHQGPPAPDGERGAAAGLQGRAEDAGIADAPELVVQGLFTYRSGLDAAEKLLGLADPPSAIFASNDDMAAAAVAIAHRRGLEVPSDLTVCGFDDTALATTIWPELTTIRQPVFEMSRTAVELLVKEIRARKSDARPTHEPHIQADFELIRRQSDAAPRRRPSSRGN